MVAKFVQGGARLNGNDGHFKSFVIHMAVLSHACLACANMRMNETACLHPEDGAVWG